MRLHFVDLIGMGTGFVAISAMTYHSRLARRDLVRGVL